MSGDIEYMRRAIELAEGAAGLASPNPTVGCVIVKDGGIAGAGWHEYALKDHAEISALRMAGSRAAGATAYVTLEPCCHHGRTPPCAESLIAAGVRRVVVPRIDPNPKVAGQGINMLRGAGVTVDVGLLAEEAGALIEAFACRVTTGRPLVVAKVGMSLDGRSATPRKTDRWITSAEARDFGHGLRLSLDALLVGSGTVLADDPELTYRGPARKGRPLVRVILDSRLRTPVTGRMFRSNGPILIFCSADAPAGARRALEDAGAEVVALASGCTGLDLGGALDELAKRDVLGVLVEGGSGVHWAFVSAGLVDKFYFIVAPLVLGGGAVPAVGGPGCGSVAEAPRFKVTRTFGIGPDLVVETYPSFSRSIISPWR